ncbi:hypothetical protein EGW08_015216, partial [Elysia chlorotica]
MACCTMLYCVFMVGIYTIIEIPCTVSALSPLDSSSTTEEFTWPHFSVDDLTSLFTLPSFSSSAKDVTTTKPTQSSHSSTTTSDAPPSASPSKSSKRVTSTTPPTQTTASTSKTTSVTLSPYTVTSPLPPLKRFCNKTINKEYTTECQDCINMGPNGGCHPGDSRAVDFSGTCQRWAQAYNPYDPSFLEGRFGMEMLEFPWRTFPKVPLVVQPGCSSKCIRVVKISKCCPGFWGQNCDECPGGARTPCNNNGVCNEGKCSCYSGFKGFACEICENKTKFGPKCSKDCNCSNVVDSECGNYVNGGGFCICPSGFKGKHCTETTDPCLLKYHRCDKMNGLCKPTGSPGQYDCVCKENFTGDGVVCVPIDPCQTNNGGCPDDMDCKFTGPNMHECHCESGYEDPGNGTCSLIDICKPSTCHPKANCETTAPLTTRCTCREGYIGNGSVCYGNILERLKEINEKSRFVRKGLKIAIHYLEKYYKEELTEHGPFTVFIPTDRAFASVVRANGKFSKILSDKDRALQIMRQHMLIGNFLLQSLQKYSVFYTLQGNPAELQIKSRNGMIRYKLQGTRGKGKVKVKDIQASNGMIHVVNALLTTEPEIEGDPEGNALQLMQQNTRHYKTTVSLIKSVNLEDVFSQPNITVFGVVDSAWESLPKGTIEYLKDDPEGKEKLKTILLNHVTPGVVGITHLINMYTIPTLANYRVNISVTNLGQVRLENNSSISQANIVTKTGFVHRVDQPIVPSYIDILIQNFCPRMTIETAPQAVLVE